MEDKKNSDSKKENRLSELRKDINSIDDQLIELWKERMETALSIAQYKKEHDLPVLDSARESELLNRIAEKAGNGLDIYARMLYNTIMNVSRSYQRTYLHQGGEISSKIKNAVNTSADRFPSKATVACQGTEGAYSGIAAGKIFQYPSVSYFKTWQDVFKAVEQGLCEYGVLPIENSTTGSINGVYDLMAEHNCSIVRSVRLKINHCLLGNPGSSIENIKDVYSHEQALNQCSNFFNQNKNIKIHVCENTAVAAKSVMESHRTDNAAVCSENCRELYNLSLLRDCIQNNSSNYTRFICISRDTEIYPGSDKTSIMLTLPHRSGALYTILSQFYSLGINLIKLESRPIQNRDFEFMFYFDISVPANDESLHFLLEQLNSECGYFHYLGSYTEVI